MHRIRVSLGAYGDWLKIRDEDDQQSDAQSMKGRIDAEAGAKILIRPHDSGDRL